MKQIILPLTVLEFTRLVIDGFMEENGLAPSPKKEIRFPQYRRSPRNLTFSHPVATTYKEKVLALTKKIFVGEGSIYHGK